VGERKNQFADDDDGGKRLGNKRPLASRPYICPRGFHYMLIAAVSSSHI
jgi:hypothetical protein